jgi:hypothetical protein
MRDSKAALFSCKAASWALMSDRLVRRIVDGVRCSENVGDFVKAFVPSDRRPVGAVVSVSCLAGDVCLELPSTSTRFRACWWMRELTTADRSVSGGGSSS